MSVMRFDKRVAVVTGAGNGLGRAYAQLLAARGAHVVVNDIGVGIMGDGGSDVPAQKVTREIIEAGGSAVPDTHSVATDEGAQAIIDTAMAAFGRVDIIINNAGIGKHAPFEQTTREDFQRILDTHLMGAIGMCRAAWSPMREAQYGRIVNITTGSMFGQSGLSAYVAAKMGVVGLTRVLAVEGASFGIKCNVVAPHAATRTIAAGPNVVKSRWARITPEQVAPAVGLLAHEDCPVTGQCIDAGGGRAALNFLGQTHGFFSSALDMEVLRDNFQQVVSANDFEIFSAFPEAADFFAAKIGLS